MMAKELSQGLIDRFIPGAGLVGKLVSGAVGIGAGYLTNSSQEKQEEKKGRPNK